MKINNKELKLICDELMEQLWGDKLEIPVTISGRLTRSLGLFYYRTVYNSGEFVREPIKIVISKQLTEHYSLENIEGVIKHELCHYHLYKMGGNYSDGDKEFEDELKRIGSHSTRTLTRAGEVHKCICSCCGKVVRTTGSKATATRTINSRISKCCKAKILYGGTHIENDSNEQNCNYQTSNYISVIHKYAADSPSECLNKETNNNTNVTLKFSIEEVVVPGPRGVTCKQVYWAMRALTDERTEEAKEKIKLVAKTYPQMFEKECRTFPKKRMEFINLALAN